MCEGNSVGLGLNKDEFVLAITQVVLLVPLSYL